MKRLRVSFGAKLVAVLLSIVMIAVSMLSVIGIIALASENFYFDNGKSALEKSLENIGAKYSSDVIFSYYPNIKTKLSEKYARNYSEANTNFSFSLYDSGGNLVLSNYDCGEYSYSSSYSNTVAYSDGRRETLTVNYFIRSFDTDNPPANDEFFAAYQLIEKINAAKYSIIAILAAALILFFVLATYLIYAVGCKKAENGDVRIAEGFIDRIPLDLFILLEIFSVAALLGVVSIFIYSDVITSLAAIFLLCLAAFLFVMTLAVRCKAGNPLLNTVIYRFYKRFLRRDSRPRIWFRELIHSIPLIWKAIPIILIISFVELIVLMLAKRYELFIFWIVERMVIIPIVLLIIMNIRTLKTGVDKISGGDIDYNVNTESLIGVFREYGEGLNSINGTIKKVIDERMKSERMKTELITNVSHDIKTPLTSIVTYVDLLKTQEGLSGDAESYIAVLDRNSRKLTKLINDLVDASQFSSGSISVDMRPGDAGVMLEQTVAEYEDKFNAASLTPVVDIPPESMPILCDGRLLWRVFENLLSNICKYSLPGSRVYLSVCENKASGRIDITFSNISKSPLNISSDELLERFVRADSSRNTEGSGLGLSIAQSLVTLQKGELSITIDGDLFKTVISFKKI